MYEYKWKQDARGKNFFPSLLKFEKQKKTTSNIYELQYILKFGWMVVVALVGVKFLFACQHVPNLTFFYGDFKYIIDKSMH